MIDGSNDLYLTKDHDYLSQVLGEYEMAPDNKTWVNVEGNLMFRLGDDVGLATYDYPGMYTVHWFFKSRGKAAIKTAIVMLNEVFTNYKAEIVRGIIALDNKPSVFLSRYVGFERISVEDFSDGPNEVILLTKSAFNKKVNL